MLKITVFSLETSPNLIGQHHQKVWLCVQRKYAQQRRSSSQQGSYMHQALACHVKRQEAAGQAQRVESALPALAN